MKKSIMAMVALLSIALVGCGGDPMDVWKVSSTDKPVSCSYDQGGVPTNEKTRLDGATWEIYKGADDKYYLFIGAVVYEGTKDGKTYTFSGGTKIHQQPWSDAKRAVSETKTTITFEVKGKTFTGTYDWERRNTCTSNTNTCTELERATCTSTDEIYGVKVDPDLMHLTNGGGGD